MSPLHLTLFVVALLVPAVGRAAPHPATPAPGSGFHVGVRLGHGLPFGDVSRDAYPLSDLLRSKTTIQVEVAHRLAQHVRGGLYVELARGSLVEDAFCGEGVDCAARGLRFGLELQLRVRPGARLDPWIGLGAGAELLRATVYDDFAGGETRWTWTGLELPVLSGGLDVAVSRRLVVGPFVSASFARYSSYDVRVGAVVEGASIARPATHGWLQLGVKAGVNL